MALGFFIWCADLALDGSDISDLIRLGFGAVDPRTLIGFQGNWHTIQIALVANLPQLVLSTIYFSFNGLFTATFLGLEWNSYARERKGLRVSKVPEGLQRSTYFLQLPYRFALPLIIFSGVLHWLVSQSIFLVAIDRYSEEDNNLINVALTNLRSFGYSLVAIICFLILSFLMLIAAIGSGRLPIKAGMNLAGSCSAAISAACHSEEFDKTSGYVSAREKLQWGVVKARHNRIGHCTFSTLPVQSPVKGQRYAGAEE